MVGWPRQVGDQCLLPANHFRSRTRAYLEPPTARARNVPRGGELHHTGAGRVFGQSACRAPRDWLPIGGPPSPLAIARLLGECSNQWALPFSERSTPLCRPVLRSRVESHLAFADRPACRPGIRIEMRRGAMSVTWTRPWSAGPSAPLGRASRRDDPCQREVTDDEQVVLTPAIGVRPTGRRRRLQAGLRVGWRPCTSCGAT